MSETRPQVLRKDVQRTIVEALAEGHFLTRACRVAGISTDTFYYWQKLLNGGVERAQVYAGFFAAARQASAIAEANALRVVLKGEPGWKGSAWFLERRFPKRWGRRSQVAIKFEDINVKELSDAELEDVSRGKPLPFSTRSH